MSTGHVSAGSFPSSHHHYSCVIDRLKYLWDHCKSSLNRFCTVTCLLKPSIIILTPLVPPYRVEMRSVYLLLALASMASLASADKRVLVLLENLTVKETHSIYLRTLANKGFDLTFKVADDAGLTLKKFGEQLYDHLIIFAPTVEEFGGAVSPEAITEFIDAGGNLLVAGNSQLGEALREIASEVGSENSLLLSALFAPSLSSAPSPSSAPSAPSSSSAPSAPVFFLRLSSPFSFCSRSVSKRTRRGPASSTTSTTTPRTRASTPWWWPRPLTSSRAPR